jgi:hypothetical protein
MGPNFSYFVFGVGGAIVLGLLIFGLYKWEAKHATNKCNKAIKKYYS